MKEKTNRLRGACGVLAAILWLAALATGITRLFAGSPAILETALRRYAPPQETGLPAEEYAGVARMTADFLTGRETEFQWRYTDPERGEILCFQPHEAAHMADCRALILLDTRVFWISLILGFVLLGAGLLPAAEKLPSAGGADKLPAAEKLSSAGAGGFWRGMRAGLRAMGLVALVLLTWAAVNFDGFFITFHRLAFSNDGWLLDPRTDLLIRLMPTGFFIALGVAGGLLFILAAAVLYGAAARGARGRNPRKGETHGI